MAETLLPNVIRLVGHMSANSTTWSNSIMLHGTDTGGFTGGESPVSGFHDFLQGMTPNAGFIESISAYEVFQTHEGETNVEHPPLFTNVYHDAGTHDANFNGSPIGSPLPKDVCVYVRCATSGGRSGKLFIRNLLEESDVDSAVSGVWEFSSGSTRFTVARFNTLVGSTMADQLPGGGDVATHQWCVAHLLHTKTGDTRSAFQSAIASLTAIRPVWNKQHH